MHIMNLLIVEILRQIFSELMSTKSPQMYVLFGIKDDQTHKHFSPVSLRLKGYGVVLPWRLGPAPLLKAGKDQVVSVKLVADTVFALISSPQ